MSAIIPALVDHPKMVITFACVVLVTLLGFGIYRAGENAQSAKDQAAAKVAERRAESAMAEALAKVAPIKRENDSMHVRNAGLALKSDSAQHVVDEARARKTTARGRLVLHGDTARVQTDTGVIAVPIPVELTKQLAQMNLVNDSLVAAMDRRHEVDTTRILGLTEENAGLRLQIEMDSSIDVDYRKQLAAAEARTAEAEAKPKHSDAVLFLAGVATALAGVAAVAAVF